MTTTHKAVAKKATNNVVAKSALKSLEDGVEPPKSVPQNAERKYDKLLTEVSDIACVTAMEKALGFGKSALHVEIAIALAIFATAEKGVTKESKGKVMNIYKEAGFDTNPKGEDYKTCHRRMNTSAKFYTKLGAPKVKEMMNGKKDEKAIDAIKTFITTEYNFRGLNDVIAEATGVKPKQTNTAAYRKGKAAGTQRMNIDGTPDKRSAPAGDIAESQKTRAAHGLQGTSKAEASVAAPAQPTGEDNAVMARMGEATDERVQAKEDAPKFGRRGADRGIILIAGSLEFSIPMGTSGRDIQEMYAKLSILAASVRDETEIDDKYNKFSDKPDMMVTH